PAIPLTLSTYPMFCWVHFSSANSTATNGPNPASMPARKKLIPSRPFRLGLEGDRSIASDAAVMDMALASPSLAQSIEIYGWVAKATSATCRPTTASSAKAPILGGAAYRLDKEEPPA